MIRALSEPKSGIRLMGLSLTALLAAAPVIAEAQNNPAAPPAPAASTPETSGAQAPAPQTSFSRAELEKLLAPIALYPDSLLAQICPPAPTRSRSSRFTVGSTATRKPWRGTIIRASTAPNMTRR